MDRPCGKNTSRSSPRLTSQCVSAPKTLAQAALLTCAHYLPVGRSGNLLQQLTAIEVSTGSLANQALSLNQQRVTPSCAQSPG